MRKNIAFLIFLAVAVTACGPKSLPPIIDGGQVNLEQKRQQEIIIKDYIARIERVDRVGFAVLSANADMCAQGTAGNMGLTVKARSEVHSAYRDAAQFFLNIGSKPRVVSVVPGGPADKAGVKPGDVVLAVNGEKCSGFNDVLNSGYTSVKVDMALERDGTQILVTVLPVRTCASPIMVMEEPRINAFANGMGILITSGMVKFCRSDDELALVLGHELAHNSMKHMEAKRGNSLLMSILIDAPVIVFTGVNPGVGNAVGMGMYSQEFESEADYIGMYHTARAGYDTTGVADLWRRMASENPEAVTHATSHPTTATRFVALEAARDEIKKKQAEGLPLVPNMKPDK